jgi:protein with PEP-CTERM/exosortase system signal
VIVSMIGTIDAFSGEIMKTNGIVTGKVVLLLGIGYAVMLAFSHNASAAPHPMPPSIVSVPDGGATIMLLGAALGALGMARRFLKT